MDELQTLSHEQGQLSLAKNIDNSSESSDQGVKYLTFIVNNEIYGSDVDCVKEIIEYGAITKVPLTPAYLRGVINLRGNVVPVVDLANRLNKQSNKVGKRTCIIIVEMQSEGKEDIVDIGFVVDEVDEVMDIPDSQITVVPQFGTDIRPDFISGMGKIEEKFVVLLQLEVVLSIAELASLVEQESKD